MVNVVVGYLINQISSTETLSSKGLSQTDVLIFGLIGAAIVALASINMLTSDSSSTASQSQSATQTVALASGIPVLLSVTLYAGLKSGFLPLEYSQEIFYVALVLFVVGAILPSILIHPRGIVQAIYFLTTMVLTFLEIFSVKDAVFGSIFAVIIIVFFSLGSSSEKTASRYPNQGFIETAKHSVIFYLSATPIFMAFLYLSQRLISEKAVEIEVVVILGLIFALLVGYFCAGLACIQHIVLRLILWWSGAIPRNYQHFFSYGRELGFIQQVGGRYRFIHDLLREHFYENY
ncbi:hypothetical protein [Coleofasciculus sp. E1-EBD-02]|uniref:hypothetical protein n=1 Tax=Coleofasciculus sp. E1-EBD-02 TaxID=3068481 RepID=UPI003301BC35